MAGVVESQRAALHLREWAAWAEAAQASAAGPAGQLAGLLALVLRAGGKVLVCGNGGSAADSSHFAAELAGRFAVDRAALPALALSEPAALITAVANDYGFERVYARQVEALGAPGDCLLALTTSGRSANVAAAVRAAKALGMVVAALCGPDGMPAHLAGAIDLEVRAHRPSGPAAGFQTPHVQEVHQAILHAVAAGIEAALVQDGQPPWRPDPWRGGPRRRPAVFLDRDGTLVPGHRPVTAPAELELLPGAAAAVGEINRHGAAAVLVTNQAAVGRGQLDPAQLAGIHARLRELLHLEGARLDGLYFCPHPDGCACRKPLPGMMLRAAIELGLDLAASWTIGDSPVDVRAGLASGGRAVLVGPAPGPPSSAAHLPPEVAARWSVAPDLSQAVGRALAAMPPGRA